MLLSLTDLWVGRELSDGAIEVAVRNLTKTGLFERVVPLVQTDDLGARVTFQLFGAVIIRKVRIHGEASLLESKIRRRLAFRPGRRLDRSPSNVLEQQTGLIRWLDRLGFPKSGVEFEFDVRGHEAVVTVEIDLGLHTVIGNVTSDGNEHIANWRIKWAYLQPRTFYLVPIYNRDTTKAAREDVLDLFHDEGFHEVKIKETWSISGRSADVILHIKEGRRTEVRFRGNRVFTETQLDELMTFRESRSADEAEVTRSLQAIRAAYQARGHHFVRIGLTDDAPGDPRAPRTLTLRIDEGKTAWVETVRFEGNSAFPPEILEPLIGTKETLLLSPVGPGYATEESLALDARVLHAHYVEKGFLTATVAPAVVTPLGGREHLDVLFRIEEGERTFITAVDVEGVKRYRPEQVQVLLDLAPGSPYGPQRVDEAVARLQRRYRADGLPHATVVAQCALPAGAIVACGAAEVRGRAVRVALTVVEGPQVTVGEIFVRGNFETTEGTILNELRMKPGEPFDYQRLLDSQSSIRSLGLFRSVSTTLIGNAAGEQRDRVGIVIAVEEQGYQFIELALGVKTDERGGDFLDLGVSAEIAYLHNNVGGWGKRFELPLVVGNLETTLKPRWTDPRLFGTRTLFTAEVAAEMRNEVGENLKEIPLDFDQFFQADRPTDIYNKFRLAGTLGLTRRFTRRTTGTLQTTLKRVLSRDEDDDGLDLCIFGGRKGECLAERETNLTTGPGVSYDARDSALHPTKGYFLSTSTKLGFEVKGIDELGTPFLLVDGEAQWYTSRLSRRLIIAQALRVGSGFLLRGTGRVPTEFIRELGGSTTVRGFGDKQIPVRCPAEGAACSPVIGGNHVGVYNLELRVKLFWWFWAVGFYDAGTLVDFVEDVGPDTLWQSLGFGLRWLIAEQIPVRLDFGFPLDTKGLVQPTQGHFSIAYPF